MGSVTLLRLKKNLCHDIQPWSEGKQKGTEATYAAGIFKKYNIDFYQKPVGFGSGRASVNTGKNHGLKILL